MVETTPVSTLVAVTVAPATTPPETSVTVPDMLAVTPANNWPPTASVNNRARTPMIFSIFAIRISPPSDPAFDVLELFRAFWPACFGNSSAGHRLVTLCLTAYHIGQAYNVRSP